MKKQTFIQGGLILAVVGIVSKFLGLFFRWPLVMMMGDEGMGYYQMVFPLYSFFIAIAGGIPIAMSKLISENNDLGKEGDNFKLIKISIILLLSIAVATTFFLSFFGKDIIKIFEWKKEVYFSLIAISVAPLFVAIINPIRGFFQGYQNMTETAISQFLEQVGRVLFGVGLAYLLLPKGIEYAAGGAAFGATLGGLFAAVYLIIRYFKLKPKMKFKAQTRSSKIFKSLIFAAIPIAIGSTIVSFMGIIDAVLVPKSLLEAGFTSSEANILFSQLTGKATVLVHIPLTFAVAIGSALIPAISSSKASKKFKELGRNVSLAMKFVFVISLPCMMGMFFMAEPIMATIFPGKAAGYDILKYLSICIPFLILSQITTSILQGVGKMHIPIINMAIGSVVKVVLTIILVPIPVLNVQGAVIANIVSYLVIGALNFICMKYHISYKSSVWNTLCKPLLASLTMIFISLATFLFMVDIIPSQSISCILSILVGMIVYVTMILVLKIFDYKTIRDKALNTMHKKI